MFKVDACDRLVRSNRDYQRSHSDYIVPLAKLLNATREERDSLEEQYEVLATDKAYIEARFNSLPSDDPRKLREQLRAADRFRAEAETRATQAAADRDRAEEQLQSAREAIDAECRRADDLQEQLQAAEEAAQRNWDEHVERQLKALDVDPERKARLAAERERDGLLDQLEAWEKFLRANPDLRKRFDSFRAGMAVAAALQNEASSPASELKED